MKKFVSRDTSHAHSCIKVATQIVHCIPAVIEKELSSHPDQSFAGYIIQGLKLGFRIGYKYEESTLKQSKRNMTVDNPQVVSNYIAEELAADRLVKISLEEAESLGIHCSPRGIIPKKNKPGKWRLIVDLSSPTDASVNDGIQKDLCSLSSVDAVADKVLSLGKGTLIAKIDIKG